MVIEALDNTILLVIKFKIGGNLRYLSHAQTLIFFQRACVRADIRLQYSYGYNPHPRLSLPLPRPVGVESDDELLTLRIHCDQYLMPSTSSELRTANHESRIMAALAGQLPDGCELLSVSTAGLKQSYQPCSTTYIISIRRKYLDEKLKSAVNRIWESESLIVRREAVKHGSRGRNKDARSKLVDVRGYLRSIEFDEPDIIIQCDITSEGTIRLREILKLLELDTEKLMAPIRRTNVRWRDG